MRETDWRGNGALVCALLALVFLFGPAEASAQILYGSIVGNVTDASGASIPGAMVTVSNVGTGTVREVSTGPQGRYTAPTVQAGRFTIKVQANGFRPREITNVIVTANSSTRADAQLELGQVTETVTVSDAAVTLQADRAEVRAEINEEALKNLPVPLGRNYQMLMGTLPGISTPRNAHSVPSNPSRAVRFSVNGTTESNNNTRIDGASQTNVWLPHMTAYTPALESIETVNVVTNSFDAEQGLAGGAAINLSIKSGTNDVHGSGFWYHNDHHLNAYPYFSDRDNPKPKFLYNQMGGTIGGPIKRNKIFFFVSYEGTRERSNTQRFSDVPTLAMRSGDLSASPLPVYDPFTGDVDGVGRLQFANNVIPSARMDPIARSLANNQGWPAPNFTGSGSLGLNQNYLGSAPYLFDRDTLDTKVNFNWNQKLTSFMRFSYLDYRMTNSQRLGDFGGGALHPTNSNPGNGFGNTYSGTFSTTYVASTNLIFDGYFGYTLMDTNVAQEGLDQNIGRDVLGIPGTNGTREFEGGWPRLQIDGFEQLGIPNAFMPYFRTDPQQQVVLNGNWTVGTHEIRFGTDLYWQQLNHEQPEFPGNSFPASGGFQFRTATTSLNGGPGTNDYNAMGSFLLGLSRESGRLVQWPDEYKTRTRLFSAFIRDRWQVNRRLTLSYGIRWEAYPFPTRQDRGLERYDFSTNEMLICGTADIPEDCGIEYKSNYVAPRFGLAFRANDDTVFRAGYGITIDPYNWGRPLRTNYPILTVLELPFENSRQWSTTLSQGLPDVPAPPTSGRVPMPAQAALTSFDANQGYNRGYIQSWNATLERQLPGRWIGSVGYVATRSLRPLMALDANWADLGQGNAGRVLFQKFGRTAGTTYFGTLGTQKYDSMQVRADRRFNGDYQINIAYTWGHTRAYNGGTDSGGGVSIDHPAYWDLNYGPASQDRRHNFQATGVYQLPFGPGKAHANDGIAGAILGGWQFNHLLGMTTGGPLTIGAPGTVLNAPGSGQRADCIAPWRKVGTRDQWFDLSTFADPNVVDPNTPRFGTCGSGSVRGPGLINLDLGLFRKFQIGESFDIQFRAEAFNVSNSPHFGNPNTSVNSGSFGLITGLQNTGREGIDQRVFRFGLRVGW